MRFPRDVAIRHGRLFRWAGILEDTLCPSDAGIVVHSSWRCLLPAAELQHLLGPLGHRYIDITARDRSRWDGIADRVAEYSLSDTQWLILDDHGHEYPQPQPRQLIECDSEDGVWDKHVQVKVRHWWQAWELRKRR